MPEIKTCEQYVLAELEEAKDLIDDLYYCIFELNEILTTNEIEFSNGSGSSKYLINEAQKKFGNDWTKKFI